jgi:hypothetical protein
LLVRPMEPPPARGSHSREGPATGWRARGWPPPWPVLVSQQLLASGGSRGRSEVDALARPSTFGSVGVGGGTAREFRDGAEREGAAETPPFAHHNRERCRVPARSPGDRHDADGSESLTMAGELADGQAESAGDGHRANRTTTRQRPRSAERARRWAAPEARRRLASRATRPPPSTRA